MEEKENFRVRFLDTRPHNLLILFNYPPVHQQTPSRPTVTSKRCSPWTNARIAPERLDLMTLRGYAYRKLGRLGDAKRVFEQSPPLAAATMRAAWPAIAQMRDPQGGG
ncbi:hypothetical protein [Mesorhizobium sp. DCY119]|uniref:hypothetical protein n=1 Tax=Mesorhizobium sp. DCY119 TaxID=2108445 RepID=UPI001058A042|nr:hypothetical protein [Mesorhizobium sp. DCY119]